VGEFAVINRCRKYLALLLFTPRVKTEKEEEEGFADVISFLYFHLRFLFFIGAKLS